ncbi:hypothetical protein BU14_0134s0030 [Porphyra umbilicalis]|uniref:Uncharacterized protein n=1 Tax=Porphyra umbilicalis TaxID=2786 RepID=A0A1X6PA75_PORUM|nr:hypothetical protein BU14_0134s0030 [Porphyra umbilicalis]|eukprot:OSX77809.1 hypothetical protein BU14_0134s0030 [Porphyra umbilicalis]
MVGVCHVPLTKHTKVPLAGSLPPIRVGPDSCRGNGSRASPRCAKTLPKPAAKLGHTNPRPGPLVHNAAVAVPAPSRSAAIEDDAAVGETGAGTQRR